MNARKRGGSCVSTTKNR